MTKISKECIYDIVRPEAEVFKAVARDNGYRGRQKILGWDWDNDELVFYNNLPPEYGSEHYTQLHFCERMERFFQGVKDAKRVEWHDGKFYFILG